MFDGPVESQELAFAELTGREFSTPDLRRLFGVLRKARANGRPLNDPALMFDEARAAGFSSDDAGQAITDAMNAVPHAHHLAYYVQILKTEHQRDELRGLALRVAEKAGDRTAVPEETIGEALEELERLRAGSAAGGLIDTEQAIAAFDAAKDSAAAIATGFASLDRLLNGGLRAGQLAVVGGRPGSGKSALLQQIANANAAAGRGVVFITAEMTAGELAGRGLKAIGRERFRRLPVWFGETADLGRLVAETRLAVRRNGVRLLIADYLQLLSDGLRGRNSVREQEVAAVSRALKRLAVESGIAILAAAQLNRASESKERPSMADLRESGAIEQDADLVLLLRAGDDDGSGVREVELAVVKQRNGPRGKVDLQYCGRKFEFREPEFELADSAAEGWRI
jgi:replicative DNA helicase